MEQLASEAMLKDALQYDNFTVCDYCGAVYTLTLLKPSTQFDDYRFKHCPYCGYTEF
jgi:hypothetical protein